MVTSGAFDRVVNGQYVAVGMSHSPPLNAAPSRPARIFQSRVVEPLQAFMRTETSAGLVILIGAALALLWANSPWKESYTDLWGREVTIDFLGLHFQHHLADFVNDVLMVPFFFMVGLEIKRELVHGQLASPRRAALPIIAAAGGMAVPAIIYTLFNRGGEHMSGWGIPVATDIAFSLGVLALVGKRLPFSVKVFLLAIAVADDLGGILVIALFYSEGVQVVPLLVAAGLVGLILFANLVGVRSLVIYFGLGVALWADIFESGIHATLAGVVLALLTPAGPYYAREGFEAALQPLVEAYRAALARGDEEEVQGLLAEMERLARETESPLDRLERQLAPWVSFVIVPIFAVANAGVSITGSAVSAAVESPVAAGVALGLFLGKPIGILTATFLAVRLGIGALPSGARWTQIAGVGLVAGIGFTVSLFITGLAFDPGLVQDEAKMGILAGSFLSGVVGYTYLRFVAARSDVPAPAPAPEGAPGR